MAESPNDHVRIIGIRFKPEWFPGAYIEGVTRVSIEAGRTSASTQPDPLTATLEIWGVTSEEILSDFRAIVVTHYDVLPPEWVQAAWYIFSWLDNLTPQFVSAASQYWRAAGYITEAHHTYIDGVPVSTVKIVSPISIYGAAGLPWVERNKEDLSPRLNSYGIEPIPLTGANDPYTGVNTLSLLAPFKSGDPQGPDDDVIGMEVSKRVAARDTKILPDIQRLVSGVAGVLRFRRNGQAWLSVDPTGAWAPDSRYVFTDSRVFTFDDYGIGWSLEPVITQVFVEYDPHYDNNGVRDSWKTFGPANAPAGAYGSRTATVQSDTTGSLVGPIASAVLARRDKGRRKLPTLRIDLHSPAISTADYYAVLDLETGNRIQFNTGNPALDNLGLVVVEGIRETITPRQHTIWLTVFADDPAVFAHGSTAPTPPPEIVP